MQMVVSTNDLDCIAHEMSIKAGTILFDEARLDF